MTVDKLSKTLENQKIETNIDFFFKKLTNLLMKNGEKNKASKIVYKMLLSLQKKVQTTPLHENFETLECILYGVISQALKNVTPNLEVRKVRVKGSTYLVPSVLSKKRQETLAIKWLLESAQKKRKTGKLDFSTCLADEIFDASRKIGQARQKRDELHRAAQANRAFLRYRWW